ncbi:MAG: DUF4383 domain-containing protein [Thermoanaerobaculia bacterium]|nr:DUF4383 domain-containing protein [Thermoanaerobaculia bacterium]
MLRQFPPTRAARLFGAAFAAAGVAGFVPNPVLGPEGLFVANTAHNLVHLATAGLFFWTAALGERAALLFTQSFGVVYLLVGALGFAFLGGASEGHLLGVVHINQADNLLHLGLGALLAAAGFLAERRPATA